MAPAAAGLEFSRAGFHQPGQFPHDEASSESRFPSSLNEASKGLAPSRLCSISALLLGVIVLFGQGCASVGPSPQPPLASPRPSRMLRGQDPASSELGAQTSDLPGSESSLAQDGAPVPGQGAEAPDARPPRRLQILFQNLAAHFRRQRLAVPPPVRKTPGIVVLIRLHATDCGESLPELPRLRSTTLIFMKTRPRSTTTASESRKSTTASRFHGS